MLLTLIFQSFHTDVLRILHFRPRAKAQRRLSKKAPARQSKVSTVSSILPQVTEPTAQVRTNATEIGCPHWSCLEQQKMACFYVGTFSSWDRLGEMMPTQWWNDHLDVSISTQPAAPSIKFHRARFFPCAMETRYPLRNVVNSWHGYWLASDRATSKLLMRQVGHVLAANWTALSVKQLARQFVTRPKNYASMPACKRTVLQTSFTGLSQLLTFTI
jgi:hypothetical protein